MPTPADRLKELGIQLPVAPQPMASYVPTRTVPIGGGRALVFVAGQVPVVDGQVRHVGRVPDDVDLEEAREAARICALNILAQVGDTNGTAAAKVLTQLQKPGLSQAAQVEIAKKGMSAVENRVNTGVRVPTSHSTRAVV